MARTDTLGNFLTDVAAAIREKKGTTDAILASNFDTEIASIETGGGSTTVEKGLVINSFDENGYATDVSIVGMTKIPPYYLTYASYITGSYKGWLANIGGNLHLPSDLTHIQNYAFNYCTGLALTELPDTIREINDNAFGYCTNLALTKLPSNVYYLGGSAFIGCTNLALTELPSGLNSILNNAFQNCKNITIKELPEGVSNLSVSVFRNCTSITEMTFLGAVSSISAFVFDGCSNLEKLVIPNNTTVPTLQGTNAFTGTKIASGTGYIYVPDDLVESFKTATNWSTYADQIKGMSELV